MWSGTEGKADSMFPDDKKTRDASVGGQCGGMLRFVIPWISISTAVFGGVVEFDMKAGTQRPVTLESKADDSNFREPRSYAAHGSQARYFIRQIEVTNSGEKPLVGRLLVV